MAGMTEQQAIKRIKAEMGWESEELNKEAFSMGIKALEKQIPKKPIAVKPYGHKCVCGHYFDDRVWHSKYCGLCGTRLDWGNEDAE